jgi:DNA-binding MarR family transcriptional regulator
LYDDGVSAEGTSNPPAQASGAARLTGDLGFLLARANVLSAVAGNAALADFGLKVRPYSVLTLSTSEPGLTQRFIADFLQLDPSQVVALVDGLEAAGLVAREPDPADRRANLITATDQGRKLAAAAHEALSTAERALHANLTEAERADLASLLRRVAFS